MTRLTPCSSVQRYWFISLVQSPLRLISVYCEAVGVIAYQDSICNAVNESMITPIDLVSLTPEHIPPNTWRHRYVNRSGMCGSVEVLNEQVRRQDSLTWAQFNSAVPSPPLVRLTSNRRLPACMVAMIVTYSDLLHFTPLPSTMAPLQSSPSIVSLALSLPS